ncbi:rhomboid family intramembrane serine protease [Hymenobacter sp. IS2118]|uniref:rhomboid family intramembrane serine protease n=1 Tax=Hymenobacter sp. IS2118 TaxID=1505605 RepID=UPI00055501F1|nr:rhomboid family intramembrane serine protease [Hymenobacter sp. IS2118]
MNDFGIAGLAVLIITLLVSYQGFKKPEYLDQYAFRVKDIRYGRQYYRLFTSGLLHAGWVHLLFNVVTFYCFSSVVELLLGYRNYLLLYGASLLGGNLLALLLHRRENDYTAVGASGAISGLVFATITLIPDVEVGLLGVYVPGWLYGLLYVLFCAYGISKRLGNIGHDAHLGGGLVGLLGVLMLYPELLKTNYLTIAAILVPAVAFFVLLIKKPGALMLNNALAPAPGYQTVDDRYQTSISQQEADLDKLLDKINHKGLESLSAREKRQLEELSR